MMKFDQRDQWVEDESDSPGRKTGFYEKVKKVKADVAAVLSEHRTLPAEVLNSVKGVRELAEFHSESS
jgi:hypothetical protein